MAAGDSAMRFNHGLPKGIDYMSYLDSAVPVRPGEELAVDKLEPYLQELLGYQDAKVEVLQFPGGHSNLTYLLKFGDRELVLRRPPFGKKIKGAHDMGREYLVLSRLSPTYPLAPKPVAMCEDESVLGCKFYLTQRIRGFILRNDPPPGMNIDPPTVKKLCESFVDTLVELHAIDFAAVGLGELGKPAGYVKRQVSGWSKRYRDSRTDEIPEVEKVGQWLGEHIPVSGSPTLIHNDYKYDNLVLDPTDISRIIGILDWEMCTIGDPLMDLGTSLCYWVEEGDPELVKMVRLCPTTMPGSYTRRALAQRYAEKSGRDISDIVFYFCFGLFRTAVVGQQIYHRYKMGFSKDDRFANIIHWVRIVAQQALRFIGQPAL